MLIDGKRFFDVPVKEEVYEKIMRIGLWVFFKTLQANCNRFKQTNRIRKSWFKTTN